MAGTPDTLTHPPAEVVRTAAVTQAANGVCYAAAGDLPLPSAEIERMVSTVPAAIAAALARQAYYFVPLAVRAGNDTLIASRYDITLSENAVCHRDVPMGDSHCVFISTRLTDDRFSIAFEFFINVAHAFVDHAGLSQQFSEVVWRQAQERVRGETGLDAYELRKLATTDGPDAERSRNDYFAAAFADAIAIYMLATYLDVEYYELREREYPLLAPAALAERVRLVSELFPVNPGYEFAIYHKRLSR